jgi:hypothetical protein
VKSVGFYVNSVLVRTENTAPYAIAGDNNNVYSVWTGFSAGVPLVIEGVAFSGVSRGGSEVFRCTSDVTFTRSAVSSSCTAGSFIEQNGLVIAEAENSQFQGDWTLRTSVTGYTGAGYLEYKTGDPFTGISSAPSGTSGATVLSYRFKISTPGRYRIVVRNACPHKTEHNDVWVRAPDSGIVAIRVTSTATTTEVFAASKWIKGYSNSGSDQWNVQTRTIDFTPHDLYTDFLTAGEYRILLAGRSTQFKADRVILFHQGVSLSTASKSTNPQSSRC